MFSLFFNAYFTSATSQTSTLVVDGACNSNKRISDNFFGVFLEVGSNIIALVRISFND